MYFLSSPFVTLSVLPLNGMGSKINVLTKNFSSRIHRLIFVSGNTHGVILSPCGLTIVEYYKVQS